MVRYARSVVWPILVLAAVCPAQTRPVTPARGGGGMFGGGGGGYGGGAYGGGEYGRSVYRNGVRVPGLQQTFSITYEPPFGDTYSRWPALSKTMSSTFPKEVAKELNIPEEKLLNAYSSEPIIGEGYVGFSVSVAFANAAGELGPNQPQVAGLLDEKTAKSVLEAIGKKLREMVAADAERQSRQKLDWAQERQHLAAARFAEIDNRMEKLRDDARRRSGRFEVSPGTFRAAMTKLDDEHQALLLDKVDQAARAKALEEVIADQGKRLEDLVKNDAISAELQKVIDYRTTAAKTIESMYKAGQTTASELAKAQAELAERACACSNAARRWAAAVRASSARGRANCKP